MEKIDDENDAGLDPVEFLRRMMKISPEDAAEVREDAARAMESKPIQEGPTADYGDNAK